MEQSEPAPNTDEIRTALGKLLEPELKWTVADLNLLKNVESGDTVEIAFKSFPNRIAMGTVDAVLEFTGEGQLLKAD